MVHFGFAGPHIGWLLGKRQAARKAYRCAYLLGTDYAQFIECGLTGPHNWGSLNGHYKIAIR
jgi:hypothetical protein